MKKLLIAFAAVLILTACGYQRQGLVARGADGERPGVYVEMFDNRTREFGLEGAFHQAMTDWLQEGRAFRVVFDRAAAAYVVSGSLDRIEFTGASYGPDDTPTGLKAVLHLSWQIKERASGRVLRRRSERRETSYGAAEQAAMIRSRRIAALRRLASEVAEQVYVQLAGILAKGRAAASSP